MNIINKYGNEENEYETITVPIEWKSYFEEYQSFQKKTEKENK